MQPICYPLGPALFSLALLATTPSHAEEGRAESTPGAAEPASAPSSDTPSAERVTEDDAEPAAPPREPAAAESDEPTAREVPAEPSSEAAPSSEPAPASSAPFLRRVLVETAAQERRVRFSEGLLGLTGAGALFGTGFAAEGPDMTASHWLWVSSGIVALGSLTSFFIPSPFEHFAREANGKSEADLRKRWGELAEQARVERRAGAVLGALVGGAAIALGVLTLEDQVWNLSSDARLIVGTGLVSGGAFGVTKGAIDWFLPTSVERGYRLVAEPPKLALSLAGAPQGFGLGVKGVFQ